MKRKILFTLALVATACGMTSCSNDEVASSLSQGSTPIDTTHCQNLALCWRRRASW